MLPNTGLSNSYRDATSSELSMLPVKSVLRKSEKSLFRITRIEFDRITVLKSRNIQDKVKAKVNFTL
jgi:hypothetical protein